MTSHPSLWLPEETIHTVHSLLTVTLANLSVYQIKLKQFHWNVKGENFSQYHQMFEEMYTSLTEIIDDTAERIRALWILSIGTMHEFLNKTTLEENSTLDIDAKKMLTLLLEDEYHLIQLTRWYITQCADLWDDWNADFLTAILQHHEKNARMIRSTLS